MNSIIFHIDVNSAFLSWEAVKRSREQQNTPDIRTIPAIIGGNKKERHGIVLAKSTPAKKYGISTGEPIVQALKKCPELLVIPPDFKLYAELSNSFISLLNNYCPLVEQYSIDEAFLDLTDTINLYGDAFSFAEKLKNIIFNTLGFTVNIGISSNKLLAKMASDFEKPNKVHTLWPSEIKTKMWPLPVENLFFVGKSAAHTLKNLGIHTIGDLAKTDVNILISHLNKKGKILHEYANGIDLNGIDTTSSDNKGYGNSITTSSDVTNLEMASLVLLSLCETIGTRLRCDNVKTTCISVSIVDDNFQKKQHQIQLSSATNATSELHDISLSLYKSLWNGQTPIRQIGVRALNITTQDYRQYDLFSLDKYDRMSKLDSAIDEIRSKFGSDSIKRACFLDSPIHHMNGKIKKK